MAPKFKKLIRRLRTIFESMDEEVSFIDKTSRGYSIKVGYSIDPMRTTLISDTIAIVNAISPEYPTINFEVVVLSDWRHHPQKDIRRYNVRIRLIDLER